MGESLFVSGKFLDLKKKVATSEPLIKSFFAKNETFKNKVAILTTKAENDNEHVATLEKSLQVEKDFCKLKDKQINDLELKLQMLEPRRYRILRTLTSTLMIYASTMWRALIFL